VREEDFIWKLCSKLIHPSAMVINDVEKSLKNDEFRKFLAVKAVLYGWLIVHNFHNVEFVA
jgi:hypothetical protein